MSHPLANALLVVNVQEEFCLNGLFGIPHGDQVAVRVARFMDDHIEDYITVIAINHVDGGPINSALRSDALRDENGDPVTEFDWMFDLPTAGGLDSNIDRFLKARRIGHLDIVGLPLETSVKTTAVDGVKLGYDVSVLTQMCSSLDRSSSITAIESLLNVGVHVDGWWG